MKYFVSIGGQDYGPADIATLRAWASEGRITADSDLKDELGTVVKASSVLPELLRPTEAPRAAQIPSTPGNIGAPSSGYAAYPRTGSFDTGEDEYKKSLIFCIIGFLCCPVIFEVLALVYANQAKAKGHPAAQTLVIISTVLLVLQALGIIAYILMIFVFGAAMMHSGANFNTTPNGFNMHTTGMLLTHAWKQIKV